MAVPVVQTTTVQQFASSHPWSVTKAASVAAGDLLLVILASATATWTPPAGWTAGPTVVTNGRQVSSFWRIADGSEGASFSFDSGVNLVGCSVCLRISGAHQTSPINGNASGSTAFGGANPTSVASITTTVDDCLLVTGWSFSSSTGRNFTGPAGTTKVADQNSTSAQEEVWTESAGAAGATGTRSWTLSTTSADRTGLELAIAPPATEVPLDPASGQASTSLALSVPTPVPLDAASGQSSASLALSAPTQVPLDPASGQASASLALFAGGAAVPLDPASAQASASLAPSAPTQVALDAASAAASPSLAIASPTRVPLDAATGQSSASLAVVGGESCFFLGESDPLADFTTPDNEFVDAQRTVVAQYTAEATGNIEVLRLLVQCDTSTWDQLDLIIYADDSGYPGAIIDYGTVTGPGATGAGASGPVALPGVLGTGLWVEAIGISIPVVSGTDYWFGLHARGDGSDTVSFVIDDDGLHDSYRRASYPGFSSPPPDPYDPGQTTFHFSESIAFQAICAPSAIGAMTATFSETSEGNGFLSQELAPRISETFAERWMSGTHVGSAKPELRIEIRQGRFNRRRAPWNDGVYPIDAVIGDTTPPWQAFWEPTTDYVEIPGVSNHELAKNFDQRGIQTSVISVDNVVYSEAIAGGEGGIYHLFRRGYLSPLRGFVGDGQVTLVDEHGDDVAENEWFQVLNRNYQITVHEGYGDEMVKVFTGLIDEVDVTSHPDTITINSRCYGQTLADQEMFGWNIDKDLRDPITFIDKDEADNIHKGGYDAASSSHQTSHDSDLVNDGDSDTYWASNDHTGAANTEWVEILVAEGRYSDFWLGTKWANMEIYISVKPRALADGSNPTLAGGDLAPDEWVDLSMGTVPGGFGGIPYIRFIDNPNSADTQVRDLNDPAGLFPEGEFVMGRDSIIRMSFRNLHDTGGGVYRAGVRTLYSRRRTLVPEAVAQKWIRVGDVSDIVKVILRWAGFKEWSIESSGVRLSKRFLANRGMKYMDVIDKVKDSLGYEFFIGDPTDADLSIGVPVFRKSQVLDTGATPIITVTHEDLLTAIDFKSGDENLASIIRARGREAKTGDTLGGDKTKRIMYVYRPPWDGLGMAGLIKHVIHTDPLLKSADDVKFAAWFIALQEALTSVVVGGEIPAYPGIDLDDIIVLRDLATGLTTRLQIQERRSTFHTGEQAKWTMSFTGAIVDVPDVQTIVALVNAAARDGK